jgi:hypothetical protein
VDKYETKAEGPVAGKCKKKEGVARFWRGGRAREGWNYFFSHFLFFFARVGKICVFKIGGQWGYTTVYDPDNLVHMCGSCTPLMVFMDKTTIR